MQSLKWLWEQNHKINDKAIEVDAIYYKDNTDTAASLFLEDADYHFFDGSSTVLEWIKNFVAFRTGIHGSAIGFDGAARDLFEKMKDNMSCSNKQVFVGYSRGGAIAMLALIRFSIWCYKRGLKPHAELVTFEMPKAGSRRLFKFCDRLEFKHTRVVMEGDIVPKVVPWWCDQYTTNLVKLRNSEKGWKNKHKNVGKYL